MDPKAQPVPTPCHVRGQLPPSHIQASGTSRDGAANTSLDALAPPSRQSIPSQKLDFSSFHLYPWLLVLSLQIHTTDQHRCPASKQSQGLAGGWKWGELSLRGHRKASAANKFNTNICTALKVTVGNTGKSSRLMSLPDSREFNASSRLGFLSLDWGHSALEGSSSFEGHSGQREGNEAFVTCAPFKAPAAPSIELNLSSPSRG